MVDTGRDPDAIDACLQRLEVERVPLLVLSHFHADHVDGLPGVLRGRDVGRVLVTGTRVPAAQAAQVRTRLAAAGVPSQVPAYGLTRTTGDVTWQVLGPVPGRPVTGDEGTRSNDASLVVLARVRGLSVLLSGDVEPGGQRALADALGPGLPDVDVLKVPHHGSDAQADDVLAALTPEVAVVSVGEDNEYGHPSGRVLDGLRDAGVEVVRTDRAGDVLVTVEDGEPGLRTRE